MIRISAVRAALQAAQAPCARTLTCLAILMLTAFLAGCAAATGGGTDGTDTPTESAPPPPPTPMPDPPANSAPIANAGADITIELPTDNATLSGSATDDGQPGSGRLTYQWQLVSGPAGPGNSPGVTLANATATSTNARFAGGVGDYVLRFNASDGQLTGSSTVHVSVKSNPLLYPNPPSASSPGWPSASPADE